MSTLLDSYLSNLGIDYDDLLFESQGDTAPIHKKKLRELLKNFKGENKEEAIKEAIQIIDQILALCKEIQSAREKDGEGTLEIVKKMENFNVEAKPSTDEAPKEEKPEEQPSEEQPTEEPSEEEKKNKEREEKLDQIFPEDKPQEEQEEQTFSMNSFFVRG